MDLITPLIFVVLFELVCSKGCQRNFIDRTLYKEAQKYYENKTFLTTDGCPLPVPYDSAMPIFYKHQLFEKKLSKGACISKKYSKESFPTTWKRIEKENFSETFIKDDKNCSHTYFDSFGSCGVLLNYASVYTIIKNYTIREIDERKSTVTMDLSLKLMWSDIRIFTYKEKAVSEVDEEKGIEIGTEAAKSIWKPELPVYDLADYKAFKDSLNMISLKIRRQNYLYKDDCMSGPILSYEIEVKPTFYCLFDLSNYPLDKSYCKFRLGGTTSNIAFKLVQQRNGSRGNQTFEISDLTAYASLAEDYKNIETKTSIGLDIVIERHVRPYMLKYYIPCIMIVLISQLGFLIPLDALPGRVALVVTQFLTLTNLFIQQLVGVSSTN